MLSSDHGANPSDIPEPVEVDGNPGFRARLMKSASPFRVAVVIAYLTVAAFALFLIRSESAAPGVPILIIVVAAVAMRTALAYERRRSGQSRAR